jgi:REP element-mobilizing transposase RayT
MITPPLWERLVPYLGGIARDHKTKLIAAGGIEDHIHLLLSLPKTLDIAKAMQLIKGDLQNGSTTRFRSIDFSNGRKVTGHFRSASRKRNVPSIT